MAGLYARGALALTQPDHGVLRKAQRGDERAFNLIVRAYEQPVYNYVLRLVGDRSLAEDLTQEVFLRVYQGLPKFSMRCKFTTWLFQVTKNRVLDELRALERRPRAVVALDDIPPLEVVDQPFERTETIDAVWRAVEDLTVDLKMALLLRDVVGLSYTEIADALEITLATVKWRIYKAREEVATMLARDGITARSAKTPGSTGLSGSSAKRSKNASMPDGVNETRIRAGVSPTFWKQCGTPRGTKTKDPSGASLRSSPSRKRSRPSSTYHHSSSLAWVCSGGPSPGATTF